MYKGCAFTRQFVALVDVSRCIYHIGSLRFRFLHRERVFSATDGLVRASHRRSMALSSVGNRVLGVSLREEAWTTDAAVQESAIDTDRTFVVFTVTVEPA